MESAEAPPPLLKAVDRWSDTLRYGGQRSDDPATPVPPLNLRFLGARALPRAAILSLSFSDLARIEGLP